MSVRMGEGVDRLKSVLTELAAHQRAAASPDDGWPQEAILHIDRAFTLPGIGTVVTGTLRSGTIAVGDRVHLLPGERGVRVRSIHMHDRPVEVAAFGGRVALNLAGVHVNEVARGDLVVSGDARRSPSYRLDVHLALEPGVGSLEGERVQVHHGCRDVPARVVALEDAMAQLRLESELFASPGDRLVLRSVAPPDTLGGARVIDASPPRHRGAQGATRARLIESGAPEAILERALRERPEGLPQDAKTWAGDALLAPALRRFPPARWDEAAVALLRQRVALDQGGRLLHSEVAKPEPAPASGPAPPGEVALAALDLLRSDGREPRSVQALADALGLARTDARAALDELVNAGAVVRLGLGVHYPTEELAAVEAELTTLIEREGALSIGELRDSLGTSRKYAQALLDWLDARRVTIRRGDRHELRSRSAAQRRG